MAVRLDAVGGIEAVAESRFELPELMLEPDCSELGAASVLLEKPPLEESALDTRDPEEDTASVAVRVGTVAVLETPGPALELMVAEVGTASVVLDTDGVKTALDGT